MKIIIPKDLCEIDWTYGPLFFLAGPIKGGNDWQFRAIQEIQKHLKHFYGVNPCRYSEKPDHPLLKIAEKGSPHFTHQTFWERHYLKLAASCCGCIIFWLPCESKDRPRTDGQPYGRDTLGEMGRWSTHLSYNPTWKMVFGAEENFPGLAVMKRNLFADIGKEIPIYPTLEETIAAAVTMATEGK